MTLDQTKVVGAAAVALYIHAFVGSQGTASPVVLDLYIAGNVHIRILTAHMHAAAAFGAAVAGDSRVTAHVERAVDTHAAGVGSGVAGDGRVAAHVERAVGVDIHTAAVASDVAADGAAVHVERAAGEDTHTAAAAAAVAADGAAVHRECAVFRHIHA